MSDQNYSELLDLDLDDLADLPDFAPLPAGVHRCTLEIAQKTINNSPAMEVSLTAIETIELADAENDKPATVGQKASALYMMNNEFGQGAFKKLIKPLAVNLGVSSLGDLMSQSKGMEVEAVTAFRKAKLKPGETEAQKYFEIKRFNIV